MYIGYYASRRRHIKIIVQFLFKTSTFTGKFIFLEQNFNSPSKTKTQKLGVITKQRTR